MLLLRQHSQLLSLDFVLEVRGPGLQEQFSRLWIEDLFFGDEGLRVHGERSLLGEQTCVEGVLGQECLAEFAVTEFAVVVLVKARHEKGHFVVGDAQTQVFQTVDQFLDRG